MKTTDNIRQDILIACLANRASGRLTSDQFDDIHLALLFCSRFTLMKIAQQLHISTDNR